MLRINYFVYKPVEQDRESPRKINSGSRNDLNRRKRYISLMSSSESDQYCDSKDIDEISRVVI